MNAREFRATAKAVLTPDQVREILHQLRMEGYKVSKYTPSYWIERVLREEGETGLQVRLQLPCICSLGKIRDIEP